MPVKHIGGEGEYDQEIGKRALTVVDFFAEWCGPCKQIAPVLEALSAKYPSVNFIKVDVDEHKDIAGREEIKAMPTFKFFISGKCEHQIQGADPGALEQSIIEWAAKVPVAFGGSGVSLGGEAKAQTREQLAAARAARYGSAPSAGAGAGSGGGSTSVSSVLSKAVLNADGGSGGGSSSSGGNGDDEDEALARVVAMSMAEADAKTAAPASSSSTSSSSSSSSSAAEEKAKDAADEAEARAEIAQQAEWDEEMVPLPVDEGLLAQLMDMGFSDTRARKAIHHGTTVEGALGWLTEHENDPELDQPYMVRKADTLPKKELTPEEKAAKLAAVTARIKQRRVEREKAEKAEELRREKERRERGQKMDETQEKRDAMVRRREADKVKKEKEDQRKERERLRAEIERDKQIRRLNKGVMPSVLGVDGYNPSAIQYDQKLAGEGGGEAGAGAGAGAGAAAPAEAKAAAPAPKPAAKPSSSSSSSASSSSSSAASLLPPGEQVDSAIQVLLKYRGNGEGGAALKLLHAFLVNVLGNPGEAKYRSINTESAAYKSKLGHLVGPANLLRAVGFEKSDEGKWVLKAGEDAALLQGTADKLAQAEALFRQMNP